MQLRQALESAIDELTQAAIGKPRLQAEVLVFHLLGCDRAYLYAHPERELSASEFSAYRQLIARRAAGEPLQYITGHQEFWKADFLVTPAVLIPRPETEHLIEAVLQIGRESGRDASGAGLRLIDVGTGSGAIAVTLARELPQAEIWAVDLSDAALEVARSNAARLLSEKDVSETDVSKQGGARVRLLQSDLLAAIPREANFDFVVANLPYVAEGEADGLQREVAGYEPAMALYAGEDGLDVIRRLIPQAREALRPGGWLLMEMGQKQSAAVRALLHGWQQLCTTADLAGIARVMAARKPF